MTISLIPRLHLNYLLNQFYKYYILDLLSSCSAIFITLIPISLSRFIIDLCIGAAPLHFGKREACILINPFLVKFKISFGMICPYATTIASSASMLLKYSNSSLLSFKFFGVLKSKFSVSAIPWIGDLLIF
jgi:hypothetical protein